VGGPIRGGAAVSRDRLFSRSKKNDTKRPMRRKADSLADEEMLGAKEVRRALRRRAPASSRGNVHFLIFRRKGRKSVRKNN